MKTWLAVLALLAIAGTVFLVLCDREKGPDAPASIQVIKGTVTASNDILRNHSIVSIDMMDSRNGWALSENVILHTSDGGKSWMDVFPQKTLVSQYLTDRLLFGGRNVFFLDEENAFTAVDGPEGLIVAYTNNQGRDWHISIDVPRALANTSSALIERIFFLDSNCGWILSAPEGSTLGSQVKKVYRTVDGSKSWTLVSETNQSRAQDGSLPFGGHAKGIKFRNESWGWVNGSIGFKPSFAYFYETRDGGKTWSHKPLVIPRFLANKNPYLHVLEPIFFGQKKTDGVLPVTCSTQDNAFLVVYVTSNGGETWKVAGVLDAGGNEVKVSFVDTEVGWAVSRGLSIYRTTNGGKAWTRIDLSEAIEDVLSISSSSVEGFLALDFVDKNTGWLILDLGDGSALTLNTTNGGLSWVAQSRPQ